MIREAAIQNPTLVVLTDRNGLDDQLFGQFQRCADILGQTPVQAASRDKLRERLAVASGGVVFTTIQKFLPEKGEKRQNQLSAMHIARIVDTYQQRPKKVDGYARRVNMNEVEANGFNLNISRT